MTAGRTQAEGTATMPNPTSARPATARHLKVVSEPTPQSAAESGIDFSVLDAARAAYGEHRTTAFQGEWQESPRDSTEELDPDLAATEIRRLGTGDVVEGLSDADNARLTSPGYRKLSDALRAPTPHAAADIPRAQTVSQVAFGSRLTVRTLKPAADRRLEFSALASQLGINPGITHELVESSVGGVPAFLLVEAPHLHDKTDRVAVLRSKSRLAFSESAQRAMTALWDRDFMDIDLTVVGPGTNFVAAILPPEGLAAIFNNKHTENEDGLCIRTSNTQITTSIPARAGLSGETAHCL